MTREKLNNIKDRKAYRVLVVDDNKNAAAALGKFLEADGYGVEIAYDGDAALVSARESNPDSIILDIDLPGKDGYEVARILRQELGSRAILIALTGYYGKTEDKIKAQKVGFDHHLTRPVLVADIEKLFTIGKF